MPAINSATRQVRRDLVSSVTRRPPNQSRSGGPGSAALASTWRRHQSQSGRSVGFRHHHCSAATDAVRRGSCAAHGRRSRLWLAFRFWHDVNHVRRGLSFDLVDELELANWHLAELTGTGFGPETTAWQLLHADLVGQIYVMALVRRFPLDQGSFWADCVRRGFDEAVLTECGLVASP